MAKSLKGQGKLLRVWPLKFNSKVLRQDPLKLTSPNAP